MWNLSAFSFSEKSLTTKRSCCFSNLLCLVVSKFSAWKTCDLFFHCFTKISLPNLSKSCFIKKTHLIPNRWYKVLLDVSWKFCRKNRIMIFPPELKVSAVCCSVQVIKHHSLQECFCYGFFYVKKDLVFIVFTFSVRFQ